MMSSDVGQMKLLDQKLKQLNEMPKLHDDELPLGIEANISLDSLDRSYVYYGSIRHGAVKIYEKKNSSGFVAGVSKDDSFAIFLDIKTRKTAYPVVPKNLNSDYHQVSMVVVGDQFADHGYTREVYEYLASKFDLVSDHEQYLGAVRLWRSLSRSDKINIYVYDGEINDYIHNDTETVKYNGKNISDSHIWGDTVLHSMRLLVATKKEIL